MIWETPSQEMNLQIHLELMIPLRHLAEYETTRIETKGEALIQVTHNSYQLSHIEHEFTIKNCKIHKKTIHSELKSTEK